jgi:hypothetical protein
MNSDVSADSGSFRDPLNRVYRVTSNRDGGSTRILRGLHEDAFDAYCRLAREPFFERAIKSGRVVRSEIVGTGDTDAAAIFDYGWAGVLEHDEIPFISYPYEWPFSMLKQAALLQLHLVEQSMENGWTLKDATPFNIQWLNAKPIFIDVGSFEPLVEGEPWVGYRQFCSMYLTPLMLRSHLGLDHLPLLRSYLDGIPPTEAVKFFTGVKQLKKGVLSHIVLPAKVENAISNRERDDAQARERKAGKHTKAMLLGLVQSLQRLVRKLDIDIEHTDWSHYDKTHSYVDKEHEAKKSFVLKQATRTHRRQIWDIGSNTGTFSRLVSEHCDQVIALDGDHNAIEQLYRSEKTRDSNILPLVMNLANQSPGQGWDSSERLSFSARGRPDLILCLALIHHTRISANIPNAYFLRWLRSFNSDVVIEFVDRDDEMVIKLLTNKKEKYPDYNIDQFRSEAERLFTIEDSQVLKGGKRTIFFMVPR